MKSYYPCFYMVYDNLSFLFVIQIAQFKHMLGAKPTPQNALNEFPLVRHRKDLKLPQQFDARTAWAQCTTIGRILG